MTQRARDALLIVSIVAVVLACHQMLRIYLVDLDRPLFLEVGFLSSLAVACLYDFKSANWRIGLIGCLGTSIVFLLGTSVALWLRHGYIEFLDAVLVEPEVATFLGHDLHAALSARYVGYGGCFAVGSLLVRLTLGSFIHRRLSTAFDSGHVVCQSCGQSVPG